MTTSFGQHIKDLIARGKWQVTVHGQRKVQKRHLVVRQLLVAMAEGQVVEQYPDHHL